MLIDQTLGRREKVSKRGKSLNFGGIRFLRVCTQSENLSLSVDDDFLNAVEVETALL